MNRVIRRVKNIINNGFTKIFSKSDTTTRSSSLPTQSEISEQSCTDTPLPSGDKENHNRKQRVVDYLKYNDFNIPPCSENNSMAGTCFIKSSAKPSGDHNSRNKSSKKLTISNPKKSNKPSKKTCGGNKKPKTLTKKRDQNCYTSFGVDIDSRSCKIDTADGNLVVKKKKKKPMKTTDLQKHLAEMHLKSHAVCPPDWSRPLAFDLDNAFMLNELLNEIESRMRLRAKERHRYFSQEMRHKLVRNQIKDENIIDEEVRNEPIIQCDRNQSSLPKCTSEAPQHGHCRSPNLSNLSNHCAAHRHPHRRHRHKKHHHRRHHRHLVSPPSVIQPMTHIEITEEGVKAHGYPELDMNRLVDPSCIHSSSSCFSGNSFCMDF